MKLPRTHHHDRPTPAMGARLRAWTLLAGVYLAAGLATAPCSAQSAPVPRWSLRLTVRPHEAATATRTAKAGHQSVQGARCASTTCGGGGLAVYVPESCVGARRCPLLLYSNLGQVPLFVPLADKYGIIVAEIGGFTTRLTDSAPVMAERVAAFDADLKELLATVAIDPDKIAILGGSATGMPTVEYGVQNMDIFSRVLVFTQQWTTPPPKTPALTNEYYVAGGLQEQVASPPEGLWARSYPTTYRIEFREHGSDYEDYDAMGRWLEESWAIPDPTRRTKPATVGAVRLTTDALTKVAAFWDRFATEPDSIRVTARRTLVREVVLPIEGGRVSTLMADMTALAARYPSVAAAFQAAGLTPEQYDAYRAAFASACIVGANGVPAYFFPVLSTSTVAQNVTFLYAHPDEWSALWAKTDLWRTP